METLNQFLPLLLIVFLIYYFIILPKKKKRKEEDELRKRDKENSFEVSNKWLKVEKLELQFNSLKDLHVLEVNQFRDMIQENEEEIIKIGGDNQLFTFLKVDSFLKEYRNKTINDINSIGKRLDVNTLKLNIEFESKRDRLHKIAENIEDIALRNEGKKTIGFDSNLDILFKLGDNVKPSLEHQIKTLEFYSNISTTMLVFYLSGKKINYFEIHSAFDKLGVFNSNWEKGVLNKLNNIEERLSEITNGLTRLNDNFIELIKSNDRITNELKSIDSTLVTGNLLSSINVYQNWRISKKISN